MEKIEKEIMEIIRKNDLNNDVRFGLRTALEIIRKYIKNDITKYN